MKSIPCRIAFGITELDPGGAERMFTELISRLERSEWEPHVYCLGPEAHYARVLRERDIPVTCFGGGGAVSAPRVLWQWTRALRRFQPQILYTFLFHANLLGRIAGRWAGVPFVLAGHRVAERRTAWHGRLDRWTNFLVDRNVCVSRGVADFAERTVGLEPRKTVVIPNAVEVDRFAGARPADLTRLGIPSGSRVLITIGRVEHQKGIDVLLSAVPLVVARFPDVHFLIVGDGPERRTLEELARSLGVSEQVHWAGWRGDVPELLAASTGMVHPSRWEGMPNVVLEAMAAGKPIVATDVEGARELVRPELNGWLVPCADPQALGEAVCWLLAEVELGRRMGHASQEICLKEFTFDTFVARHTDLFREIVSQGGLSPK